jgi:uncharacterized protein (TIGR00255 family)
VLRSMTGYGTATIDSDQYKAHIEIRSVNHRYLDLLIRLPAKLTALEDKVRMLAGQKISRGRVEIFINLEEFGSGDRTVKLDKKLLIGYAQAFREAEEVMDLQCMSREALLAIPGLFVLEEEPIDTEKIWPLLKEALNQAFQALIEMREAEGKRLEADMFARLVTLEKQIATIEERAPVVVEEYRRRLTTRINELVATPPVSEERIATEVALFADRACITEEIVRFNSHIAQFRSVCAAYESGGIGRKLDFLLQELNREVNTIGSKAADGQIAHLVVSLKAELEKVREQVQNIE